MAAVSTLGVTFNTTNGTKTVTATPSIGDLIVIITAHSGNTSAATPTDNQPGGTYLTVLNSKKATSADTMMVHVRTTRMTTAVSTIFTHAPGTTTGGGLAVLKVTGIALEGLLAILRSAKQENQAGGGTPTPNLVATPGSGNPIIGAVFNATNPATLTARASYTEHHDVGYATPTTGLEVMSRNSGETSASIAWGGTSASAFCSVAIEVDTTAPLSTFPHDSPLMPRPGVPPVPGKRPPPPVARPGPGLPGLARFNSQRFAFGVPGVMGVAGPTLVAVSATGAGRGLASAGLRVIRAHVGGGSAGSAGTARLSAIRALASSGVSSSGGIAAGARIVALAASGTSPASGNAQATAVTPPPETVEGLSLPLGTAVAPPPLGRPGPGRAGLARFNEQRFRFGWFFGSPTVTGGVAGMASGVASSAGSALLAVVRGLRTTGSGQAGGVGAVSVIRALRLSGVSGSHGVARLGRLVAVSVSGVGRGVGTASVPALFKGIAASGVGTARGTAQLRVTIALAARGVGLSAGAGDLVFVLAGRPPYDVLLGEPLEVVLSDGTEVTVGGPLTLTLT